MARNRGGIGAGAMKMGGMGKKPRHPPSAGIGTKMAGVAPPRAPAVPRAPPPMKTNPLAGGPMPPVGGGIKNPGGGPGGMKKGGEVHKHAKGGAAEPASHMEHGATAAEERRSAAKGHYEPKSHLLHGATAAQEKREAKQEQSKYARGGAVGHGDSKPRHACTGSFK
jgi:hypothetical protein